MNNSDNYEPPFERLGAVWSRRRTLILGVFALVAIPGVCVAFALPAIFEAQATVVPVGNAVSQSSLGGSGNGAAQSLNEQVLSRSQLTALIKRFRLYPQSRQGYPVSYAALAAEMRKQIDIKTQTSGPSGNSQPVAFTVSFRGAEPGKVAEVTNALAASYQAVAVAMQRRQSAAAVDTLRTRLAAVHAKLNSQQALIDRFRRAHSGALPDQQDINLAAMQSLNTQLRDNDSKQLQATERRASILQQMDASGDSALPHLQQQLANLELRYTDKYPGVIALKQQIAAVKKQQAAGGDNAARSPLEQQLAGVEKDLARLKSQEKRLQSRIASYQAHLDDAPETAQKLRSLTQGYSETSELYTDLLKRYEQARVAQVTAGRGGPQFSVFESAEIPKEPVGPARLRILAMSLVLGLGLAGLAAAFVEQRDTSFHSLKELQEFTSVPVLATIPVIVTNQDKSRRRWKVSVLALAVLGGVAILGTGAYAYAHHNQPLSQRLTHHAG